MALGQRHMHLYALVAAPFVARLLAGHEHNRSACGPVWLDYPRQIDAWLRLGSGLPGLVPAAARPDCESHDAEAQQRESN
jgi:hypothetical protein